MSFFSLSQVQKHKTVSVMWPNERMRLNSISVSKSCFDVVCEDLIVLGSAALQT